MTFEEWWDDFDISAGPSYEKRDLAELAFEAGRVEGREEAAKIRHLLYAAIMELEYVQSVENCGSGLCASAKGREIIKLGMELLDVNDLSFETLAQREAYRRSRL